MKRILLAEDNVGDVFLVRHALKEHGIEHNLEVVKDGATALAVIAELGSPGSVRPCPDLLLLDLNLPKADGAQVLAALRQHTLCAHVPVVVVTSSDNEKDRSRMSRLGISYYFCKPIDLDDFLLLGAVVRQVLQSQVTSIQTSCG